VAVVEVMVEAMVEAVVVACELPKAVLVKELVQDELALVLSAVSSWQILSPSRKWKMRLLTPVFTPNTATK
jgi:hypothetical protein